MLIPERYEWNSNIKIPDVFALDRLNLPQQVLNGRMYGGLPGDATLAQTDPQAEDVSNGFADQWRGSTSMEHDVQVQVPGEPTGRSMSQIEKDQTSASHMQRYPLLTDGTFDGNTSNSWNLEDISQAVRSNQLATTNISVLVPQGMITHNGNNNNNKSPKPERKSTASSVQDLSSHLTKHALLHELFEYISDPLESSAVPNFDSLVTEYYCETFPDSSPLANEQRLSRNRRLPKVVADLFSAAQTWTAWEAHGFHEEILKTAEAKLISESDNLDVSEVAALLDAQGQQQQQRQQDRVVDNGGGASASGSDDGGVSLSEQMASQQTNLELKRLIRDKVRDYCHIQLKNNLQRGRTSL